MGFTSGARSTLAITTKGFKISMDRSFEKGLLQAEQNEHNTLLDGDLVFDLSYSKKKAAV